mgnify:CR=1 FL=1
MKLFKLFGRRSSAEEPEKEMTVTAPAEEKENWRNKNLNIKKVNELVSNLQENLGDACLASAIIAYESGASIASYRMDDKSCALLSKFATFLVEMVDKAGINGKVTYQASQLSQNIMSFNLVFKNYCWLTVVNTGIVPLGMIMNGVLPECIENFQDVMS